MLRVLFVSLAVLCSALANGLTAQQLEFKMISSGPNRPRLAIWNSPMREILAGLHAKLTPEQLAAITGLTQRAVTATLDSLRAEGIVSLVDGALRPSCMVVSADEGASLASIAGDAARDALPLMRRAVRDVRARYRDIPGLSRLDFDDVSFFLASDVLLDNWQINAVERLWLKAERPLRGGARYYCAIFARAERERESFGILGNQMVGLPGGRLFGVYGNRRGGRGDAASLSQARLAVLLSLPDTTARPSLLAGLADQLQRVARGASDSLPPGLAHELEAMGLVREGRARFAVLDPDDDRRLRALASSVTDSLVAFLEGQTPLLRAAWSSSTWHTETTFEEYRIWWYHFFYTALTELLANEGAIRIPATGLFHYVVLPP